MQFTSVGFIVATNIPLSLVMNIRVDDGFVYDRNGMIVFSGVRQNQHVAQHGKQL